MSMKDPFLKSTAKSLSWQNGVNSRDAIVMLIRLATWNLVEYMSQSYVLGSRGISHNRRDLDVVREHRAAISI